MGLKKFNRTPKIFITGAGWNDPPNGLNRLNPHKPLMRDF
ncbi:hypothetical protein D1AOALGA4SA_8314 [Olavius algarvensis Delta 1 endosymbiont]|nr:hypothetical protein D1AOALGA4SA_8314 [Olavius algarvensis Delta 1 endosymbiont]